MLGENFLFKHEANQEGRDFVVGDLHGAFDKFEFFLEHVNFDKKNDRMFSVGDLCDRGPKSFDCMNLIDESWFYSVLGNHEQMFHDYFMDRYSMYARCFFQNGGEWANRLTDEEGKELASKFELVPRIRTVKKKDGTQVHIVHAELYPDKPFITDDDITEEGVKSLCVHGGWDGESSYWGRWVFGQLYNTDLTSVNDDVWESLANKAARYDTSMIISGHTIMTQPLRLGNLFNIDTGGYIPSRSLTVYDINADVTYSVRKDIEDDQYHVTEVTPFLVEIS